MKASTAVSSPMSSMVERMTAILDSSSRRRSLQDISILARLPRSTAHRILEQLVQLGWVEHSALGYSLGWRARHFSAHIDENALLREVAAPYIHEFALRTPFIVHLAVLDGPFVRYLDKVGGPEASSVPSRVGGFLPAHLTAVGKAMLAYVDTDALDLALDQFGSREGAGSIDLGLLYGEIASVRMRGGLSSERNSSLAAVACVGAPIFGCDGQVVGGLSLCDGGSGKPLDQFAPLLRQSTQRISARLATASALAVCDGRS